MEGLHAPIPASIEARSSPRLEAPYITAVKAVTRERMPEQAGDFDRFFDAINNELMGNGEGRGLFIWESKLEKYKGVKFLAAQIHITEKLVRSLSNSKIEAPINGQERRLSHLVRFIEPAWGLGNDGSGLSALDMAFSPALDMANTIATAIRNGEVPPTGDIFLLGSLTAIGGETTADFNQAVKQANARGEGLDPYGEIFAEFMLEHLPSAPDELDKTRIVLEGVSKGTITASRTFAHLPEYLKPKTETIKEDGKKEYKKISRGVQLLLDTPAGLHGSNLPTQIGRGLNMLGFVAEALARSSIKIKGRQLRGSTLAKVLTETQPQFYRDIGEELGILRPDETQVKLKKELTNAEIATLVHGTPLDKQERTYIRISTPDPANINFRALRRVFGFGHKDKPRAIQDLVMNEGEMAIFPNSNKLHMWHWLRNIESGSWSRKMDAIVNRQTPKREAA
jgi:hypothetical protein